MNDLVTRYLRGRCNVQQTLTSVTTSWKQVMGADPDRFDLWVSADATNAVAVAFQINQSPHGVVTLSTSYNFVEFSEDTVGELIKYPVYAIALAGTVNVVATSSSYLSEMRQLNDRLVRQQLSNPSSL